MSTIVDERLDALTHGEITLNQGGHSDFESGHCAMEVVAWLANEGHTDAPACASPVLRRFTISLNDNWSDSQRQKLIPFLPRMVGTGSDGQDEARSYLALDWLIRTYTPAWLDLAGLTREAAELRNLRRIVDLVAVTDAATVVRSAQKNASAAGAAAWDAAGSAAGAAAGDAAWAAAWAAARDAAGAAARDAARAAARDAAGDAAWAAAWAAAGSAAGAAARAAAGDDAWDALKPTVETLQASALELLDRMIDPSKAS